MIWIVVAGALLFGAATALVASSKERSPVAWGFLGLILGPLALFLIAIQDKPLPNEGKGKDWWIKSEWPEGAGRFEPNARYCTRCGDPLGPAHVYCAKCGERAEPDSG
jgi:hypothetical protein